MSKYSLQYRAAQRRALKSIPLTQKPVTQVKAEKTQVSGWQSSTYAGFNPETGKHQTQTQTGEVVEAERIPGYGAEFGGVATGSTGLLSQGFWSN